MIQAKINNPQYTQFSQIFRTDTHSYTIDDIEREYEEWRYIFLNILGFKEDFEFDEFSISNRFTSTLAKTKINRRTKHGSLIINGQYIKHHSNPDSFHSTLAHETIHTLVGCFNHGDNFKWAGRKLMSVYNGLIIGRTSMDPGYIAYLNQKQTSESTPQNKYKIICSNCGQIFYRQRLSKVVKNPGSFRCGKCRGNLKVFEIQPDGLEVERKFIRI